MATTSLVEWRPWGRAAFEEARAAQVPVLLALGPRWCSATAAMMRGAYADPRVADVLDDRFVPIRVDAEARPDVAERYGLAGWPTTVFLTPDGDMLGGETYATAGRMRDLLRRVADAFAAQRERHRRAPRERPSRNRPAPPPEAPDTGLDGWFGDHLLGQFDKEHGGLRAPVRSRIHADALGAGVATRPATAIEAFAAVVEAHASRHGVGRSSTTSSTAVCFATVRAATGPSRRRRSCSTSTREALRLFLLPDDDGLPRAGRRRGRLRAAHVGRPDPGSPRVLRQSTGRPGLLPLPSPMRRETQRPAMPPPVDRAVYADGTALMARRVRGGGGSVRRLVAAGVRRRRHGARGGGHLRTGRRDRPPGR